MSQGKIANREGEDFSATLSAILAEVGGVYERAVKSPPGGIHREMLEYLGSPLFAGEGVFARNVYVGQTIYGRKHTVPCVVLKKGWRRPLALLGSTQTTGGSADQKIPYMLENALRCLTIDVLFVLAGAAFVEDVGILSYVDAKVIESREAKRLDGSKPAIVRFFRGTDEFRRWVSDGMPVDQPAQAQFA